MLQSSATSIPSNIKNIQLVIMINISGFGLRENLVLEKKINMNPTICTLEDFSQEKVKHE